MKILMLNPPFMRRYSRQSRSPCVTKGGTFYYPYYLAYATGVLEKESFTVKLIDGVAKNLSHADTVRFTKDFKPDLTILDTSTPSIFNDIEVGSKIKEALPEMHLSLVGTHPTNLPEETLNLSTDIDSICRREYDYTACDLAQVLENGKDLASIDGISYREGERLYHNKDRELIKNLDDLPFVSEVYKNHLDVKDYFYASVTYPEISILTARGCPYNCSFCNIPFKHSYRARSPENVVDEFEYIKNEFTEVKEVMIEDDTFPISKSRTIKICDLLVERKIKLKWSCNARVDMDLETLNKMKRAGCRLLCVGFESPNQKVLDEMHKKTTKKLQLEFMNNVKKAGILVNGCFMLGLPNDTKESIKETIEFSKKLNPDTAQFYPPMVYPGTEMYSWAKEKRYLTTEDYSKWLTEEGLHNTVVSRPDLTNIELVELCDIARREFYLRTRYILYKLKHIIIHPSEIRRTFYSGRTFYRYLTGGSFGK